MGELADLVADLQSLGALLDAPGESMGRRGGAGPADSKPFVLAGLPFTVPTLADFVASSPYAVRDTDDGYAVMRNGTPVAPVSFPHRPRFYDLVTPDGIPYWHIAALHGTDVLATTVVQTCIRWNDPDLRCGYCGIGISLMDRHTVAVKRPRDLAAVARAAVDLDGVRHFVMTMGTLNETDKGARYMARCVRAVREVVDLPIEVQFEPPDDLEVLQEVHDAGAESIGMHLESFDPDVRARVTPGKARVGLDEYFRAFERAVQIFGTGQVSSYVIVGLGESRDVTLQGCRRLVDMGVYPFVVPLRPIIGSAMEHVLPPAPDVMRDMYAAVDTMLAGRGMRMRDASAGCVRCGACSGLAAWERAREGSATAGTRTSSPGPAA